MCNCPGRLRKAARNEGWTLGEDGWWVPPEGVKDAPFRDEDIKEKHLQIAVTRPSLRWESVLVVAREKYSEALALLRVKIQIESEPKP